MRAIIFDTETTGNENPESIEAAWLRVQDPIQLTVTEEYEARYQPTQTISLGALATHHILDEELQGCPPSASFSLPADVQYIIGHNIDYDWQACGEPDVKRICTLALARHLLPNLDSHSQSALVYYFDRTNARQRLGEAHSALADVINCRLNLLNLLQVAKEQGVSLPGSSAGLWQRSEQAGRPTIMPPGKHRCGRIPYIPKNHHAWLLRQDSLDPYVKQAVLLSRQK